MIDWRETWGHDVHIVNQTSAIGAINVAGPKAREVLARADRRRHLEGGVPLPPPPHDHRRGHPLHARSASASSARSAGSCTTPRRAPTELWDALLEAGAADGITPFGIQAQRLLRLEKGHIIVSQDTDFETTPWHLGMEWAVKLDKDDFVGKAALAAQEGPQDREARRLHASTPAPTRRGRARP